MECWYLVENFGDKPIAVVLPAHLFGITEQQAFIELGCEDCIPEETVNGRILTKSQSRIILSACISHCSAIHWSSLEDTFFRDLVQANWQITQIETTQHNNAPTSYGPLINLPFESESCDRTLYPWWLSAIRDFSWGLLSPENTNTLARALKNADVEEWIMQTVDDAMQKHLYSLIAFIQKTADEKRWLFSMEWGT
ncbi:MAG: hypothetical protein EXR80_08750 [Methylococcales bacterium]|nr:hypothetical protein [Methylococcales bacterium]